MKKIIFTFFSFIFALSTVYSQKGINLNKKYPGGGKLLMSVDSSAKNVFYSIVLPNQPNTTFNYLPEISNINIQINFRKTNNIEQYRYTILVDDKPITVNKSINKEQLTDTHAGGDDEIFSSTTLGNFSIKGKVMTVLVYSIEKPLDIDKSVFYAKPIPKAKIKALGKRFTVEKGFDYSYTDNPEEITNFNLTKKDDQLIIVKDRTDIDYLYYTSIKDKQTNKIIFESTGWQYGSYINETHQFSPYLEIDKSIFKKSGNYEIIIQPLINWTNCNDCNISSKDIEKFTARYTLSINLEEESYTQKQLLIYGLILCAICGAIFGAVVIYIKKKEGKKLAQQLKEKEIAQLQLNSVRSQLNPHFLFNALAGIQNLINKNEINNANRYLGKFARLTRNVLDNKKLISLTEEKTLLDDYLQMEQLRFGFRYSIEAAVDLDVENIEIPAMLLQPFVENAVKHGIVERGSEGTIKINFEKQSSNLILQIKDNGKGFDGSQTYNGLGLALSKNRISLLNKVYKETPCLLNIHSDISGTTITIALTQWL